MLRKLISLTRRKWLAVVGRRQSPDNSKIISDQSQNPEPVVTQPEVVHEPPESVRSVKVQPERPKWSLDCFEVVPEPGKSRFHDFDLPIELMHGIFDKGFKYCTPIQEKALPEALKRVDVLAQANTGTGKSAVFLVALFNNMLKAADAKKLSGKPKALVVAPTRELVTQIAKEAEILGKYTGLKTIAVYGGVDYQKQMNMLRREPCDLIVATPGRLLDFISKQVVSLKDVSALVLDEADRMLDMGFIPDVRRIINKLPDEKSRHTMLFSATFSEAVTRMAYNWCHKPVKIEIEPEQVAVDTVKQIVYMVSGEEKFAVLYNLIQQNKDQRVIVFANEKRETRHLIERLMGHGVQCGLLTGDVAQNKREKRLEDFRSGKMKVLVATDVAGRGLHINGIEYVVNYTLPYEPEDYVHRIGRTGRAGKNGVAVSFACETGSFAIPEIEEYIGTKMECTVPDASLLEPPSPPRPKKKRKKRYNRKPSHPRRKSSVEKS